MSFDANQLRLGVVRPILHALDMHSPAAENLLLGTMAQESQLGRFLYQVGGPALGVYQIEPATHEDIWDSYLKYRLSLKSKVLEFASSRWKLELHPSHTELVWNLGYATCIARIHYLRVAAPLPNYEDLNELAFYWKRYFNTYRGAGTEEEFIENYKRYIGVL